MFFILKKISINIFVIFINVNLKLYNLLKKIMKYNKFGDSNFNVLEICLGMMIYGL